MLQAGAVYGRLHTLDTGAGGAGGLPAAIQHIRGQGHAHSRRQQKPIPIAAWLLDLEHDLQAKSILRPILNVRLQLQLN